MPQPYKIFAIYAREDAPYLEELRGQLRPLEIGGRIKVWSDREINPGVDWEQEIVQNLDTADIILILVSAAYYNSVYIHEKEIKYALTRHEKGEARVLPVIVRPCSFGDDPVISRLQVLPTDGKPVTDKRSWPERDDAWLDVVAGVKKTLQLLDEAEQRSIQAEQETVAAKARHDRERREAEQRSQAELAQREQEAAARRTQQVAWQQAAEAHQIDAYERYLNQYPKGDMVREARRRIKELKRKNVVPSPWWRYITISGAAVSLLLAVWLLPKLFKEKKIPQGERTQSTSSLLDNNGVSKTKSPGPEMVVIHGGTFDMGDTFGEGSSDEKPVHQVTLKSFYMAKTEVTVEDYLEFVHETKTHAPEWLSTGSKFNIITGTDDFYKKMGVALTDIDHPIIGITWFDAVAYCDWLSKKNGLISCYKISDGQVTCYWDADGYRLPTEAEWEYAARSGGMKEKWAGTSNIKELIRFGNCSDQNDGYQYTSPVATFEANSKGLFDMNGNVWEWCWDWYGNYSPSGYTNPLGPESGRLRIIRGGSWYEKAADCRSSNRDFNDPAGRASDVGFRLVSVYLR